MVTILDGATVTLRNVTIYGRDYTNCKWAGITCDGDATIILGGTNLVRKDGFLYNRSVRGNQKERFAVKKRRWLRIIVFIVLAVVAAVAGGAVAMLPVLSRRNTAVNTTVEKKELRFYKEGGKWYADVPQHAQAQNARAGNIQAVVIVLAHPLDVSAHAFPLSGMGRHKGQIRMGLDQRL